MLKRTKTNLIVHGVILLGIGIFFFASPEGTLVSISWLLGLAFILGGVLTFFLGRNRTSKGSDTLHLVAALLMVAVGIVIIAWPQILAILVGVVLLFEGIDFVVLSINYRRAGVRQWGVVLAIGVVGTLLGVWGILNPMGGAALLSIMLGIGCICVAADCFIALVGVNQVEALAKGVHKAITDQTRFEEAEVVED